MGINGAKQFITNAGTEISGYMTITAVTRRPNGSKEISNIIVPNGTPGYEPVSPTEDGLEFPGHPPAQLRRLPGPRGDLLGRRGEEAL